MSELSLLIWDIFCIRKIWFDLSVQKIQKIQYASSAAAEKSCQDFYYINMSAESLIKLKVIIK